MKNELVTYGITEKTSRDIVIVGSSGFAKELLWLIEENNKQGKQWNIIGFIDSNVGSIVNGYTVVGDDNWLIKLRMPINVVFGVGSVSLKKRLYKLYSQNCNISFPAIISKDAIVSSQVKLGMGCIVCAGTIITTDVEMGDFVTINLACTVGHDVVMGNFIQVNPSTNISGNVNIGNECEIGTGVKIIQGINIGRKSLIGMGSVIIRNVPDNSKIVGNPGRNIALTVKETNVD